MTAQLGRTDCCVLDCMRCTAHGARRTAHGAPLPIGRLLLLECDDHLQAWQEVFAAPLQSRRRANRRLPRAYGIAQGAHCDGPCMIRHAQCVWRRAIRQRRPPRRRTYPPTAVERLAPYFLPRLPTPCLGSKARHTRRGAVPKERSQPSQDFLGLVRLGAVPVQMWRGWAQSRCRCGGGEPSPGADVAGVGPPAAGSAATG